MVVIFCHFCGKEFAQEEHWYYRKDTGRYREDCKIKFSKRQKEFRLKNPEKVKKQKHDDNIKHREKRKITHKKYYESHKQEQLAKCRENQIKNKERYDGYKRKSYEKNKEKRLIKARERRQNNIEEFRKKENEYNRNRMKNDIFFKLKKMIGHRIRQKLKNKNNRTTTSFLSYTIEQLKRHLENLFEPWMKWENWGIYNSKTWEDTNPDTWTWQIDHIIPHSEFKYLSPDDDEFKKCWALENLRPLSSKQNFLDGVRRVRHKDKK